MGHLPIVTQQSIENVIQEGCISTRGNLGTRMIKTAADLFSDVLACRRGDLVFPWIVSETNGEGVNIGFKYVFKVAGPPRYVRGEEFPVKLPLERNGCEFSVPLSESEALDLWDKKLLWNAIGKKSLGRGRSVSHQLPMEDDRLIELLEAKNIGRRPRKIELGQFNHQAGVPLHIDSSQDAWFEGENARLNGLTKEARVSELNLAALPWRTGNRFGFEKTLEAWIMEHIDKPAGAQLRNVILDDQMKIKWFGNYLPFGVAGGNIDIVVIQEGKNSRNVLVIELKRGSLNQDQYNVTVDQVFAYEKFIHKSFRTYGIRTRTRPVIICAGLSRNIGAQRPVQVVEYEIQENGNVLFA